MRRSIRSAGCAARKSPAISKCVGRAGRRATVPPIPEFNKRRRGRGTGAASSTGKPLFRRRDAAGQLPQRRDGVDLSAIADKWLRGIAQDHAMRRRPGKLTIGNCGRRSEQSDLQISRRRAYSAISFPVPAAAQTPLLPMVGFSSILSGRIYPIPCARRSGSPA